MVEKYDLFICHDGTDTSTVVCLEEGLTKQGLRIRRPSRSRALDLLHKTIAEHYTHEELKDLLLGLNIRDGEIPGDTISSRTRELVLYLERQDRIDELIERVKGERPKKNWSAIEELYNRSHNFNDLSEGYLKQLGSTIDTFVILLGSTASDFVAHPETNQRLRLLSKLKSYLLIVFIPGYNIATQLPSAWNKLTCSDLRQLTDNNITKLAQFIMGRVTGLSMSREVASRVEAVIPPPPEEQNIDAIGMAGVKSRLHALSELIANAAENSAAHAATHYPYDALTTLVPLAVMLRWKRGYAQALQHALSSRPQRPRLDSFMLVSVDPACPIEDGLLSAKLVAGDEVLISVAGHPAARIANLKPTDLQRVLNTINDYGRLPEGVTGQSLLERIAEITIPAEEHHGGLTMVVNRNKEVLLPLIARLSMPGAKWLLPNEETMEPLTFEQLPNVYHALQSPHSNFFTNMQGKTGLRDSDLLAALLDSTHLSK